MNGRTPPPDAAPGWALAIHGGAGRMTRQQIDRATDAAVRAGLAAAIDAGSAILAGGGSALDAVEAAVRLLEDDPCFNAGRGAALTFDGTARLDAAIMDGRDRAAGAVAGTQTTRHPISLARRVMADGRHVLLAGEGADAFARDPRHGPPLEAAGQDWFVTDARRHQLGALKARDPDGFDHDMVFGTVGAVARDADGGIAAATSTGGVTGKRWDRIGDSPLIGAGTYADGRAGAVSGTGAGEFFIRVGVAHEISARIRLLGELPAAAAKAVLADVTAMGGSGGVIVVGRVEPPVWAFTTAGMNRARAAAHGLREIAIYHDE